MQAILRHSEANGELLLGASEGGLFHYGSDEDIVANLRELGKNAPDDFRFIGTAYWDSAHVDKSVIALKNISSVGWKLRGLQGTRDTKGIAELAHLAGWEVETITDTNTHYVIFTLKKKQ